MGSLKIKAVAILNEDNPEFFTELLKKGVDAVEPEMKRQIAKQDKKVCANCEKPLNGKDMCQCSCPDVKQEKNEPKEDKNDGYN